MRASVRTNQIYIDIKGIIPGALLEVLRLEYGRRLVLRTEGYERMFDVLNAELYEKEPMEMNPGAYLKFYRQDSDLTQAELGRKLGGIRRQNISSMENGRRPISKMMAIKLSKLFDVAVGRFI
jgi:DNA-binding XRE family transcriptional regulator